MGAPPIHGHRRPGETRNEALKKLGSAMKYFLGKDIVLQMFKLESLFRTGWRRGAKQVISTERVLPGLSSLSEADELKASLPCAVHRS